MRWRDRLSIATLLALLMLLVAPVASARVDVVVLPERGITTDLKQRAGVLPVTPALDPDPSRLMGLGGFSVFDPALDASAGRMLLSLQVQADEVDGSHVLRVPRRFFQQFDIFILTPDGELRTASLSLGDVRGAQRVGREFAVPFPARVGEPTRIVMLVETAQGSLRPVQLSIQDAEGFARRASGTTLVLGLVFGILLGLVFHNLMLYLSLRRRGHLLYVVAMLSLLLVLGIDSGLLQDHVLPEALLPHEPRIYVLLVASLLVTASLFFQVFVDSPRHLPRLDPWIGRLRWPLAVLGLVQLVLPATYFVAAAVGVQALSSLMLLLLLWAAALASHRGIFEGKVFLLAWSLLVASNLARTLLTLDLIEGSWLIEHLFYIGAVLEAAILAMGLSFRVRELRHGHDEALRKHSAARQLANIDPLTGAYNRRFLEHHLDALVAGKPGAGSSPGMVMIDLDDFKHINDTHGHVAGDEVLRELVRRCQQVLREDDVLCRLGGDEFVVVLRDSREADAVEVARRLHEKITRAPFVVDGCVVEVSASVGVVPRLEGAKSGGDPVEVLRWADAALYRAKGLGRNCIAVYGGDDMPGASPPTVR
ncbi:sensor domain-containing diguanylate cyclase [Alkalisalibacterium limincola]|nr:diguanylate cyclase [Alkalisalibacterium limincola]